MANERKHTGELKDSTLPIADFNSFCEELYSEGLGYDQLSEDELDKVGVITSIKLHDYPDREGRWISLHFRESLDPMAKDRFTWAKGFIRQIGADLNRLSKRLLGDLKDVEMIYGLTQVSAKWGENHGFVTKHFTEDPEIVRNHCQSITGLPPQTNDKAPLTLFVISRDALIEEYRDGGRSAPKA
jgi:hypothetical protein